MEFPRLKPFNAMHYYQKINIEIQSDQLEVLNDFCTHSGEKSLVFFDVETSGLSPFVHEVIELAALKYDFKSGEFFKFESLVKPNKQLSAKNIEIHGITNEKLSHAPKPTPVFQEFFDFIKNSSLIAYNAQFDIGFLLAEKFKLELDLNARYTFDALPLARYVFKAPGNGPENYKLATLNKFFNLNLNSHRAYEDSLACFYVFIKSLSKLRTLNSMEKFKVFDFKKDIFFEKSEKNTKLLNAIEEQREIQIIYKGGSKGRAPRAVRPIALLPLPNGLFLYSHCLRDKTDKAFNTKKITEIL